MLAIDICNAIWKIVWSCKQIMYSLPFLPVILECALGFCKLNMEGFGFVSCRQGVHGWIADLARSFFLSFCLLVVFKTSTEFTTLIFQWSKREIRTSLWYSIFWLCLTVHIYVLHHCKRKSFCGHFQASSIEVIVWVKSNAWLSFRSCCILYNI